MIWRRAAVWHGDSNPPEEGLIILLPQSMSPIVLPDVARLSIGIMIFFLIISNEMMELARNEISLLFLKLRA